MRSLMLLALSCVLTLAGSKSASGDILSVASEAAWQSAITPSTLLDFESNSGSVGNTYLGQGAAFSNLNTGVPTFWVGGGYSSAQSLYTKTFTGEGGGGFSTTFSSSQNGVAFWALDVEFAGSTVSFYDTSNNFLKSFDLQSSGTGHGAFVYGFNGFVSDSLNIGRMDVSINGDDAIWFDNVQFGGSAVPEPSALSLGLLASMTGFLGVRRRRRTGIVS